MFEELANVIVSSISENLVLGVFLASFVETIIPPLPTLLFLPTAGFVASHSGVAPAYAALLGIVGGAGATLSAVIIYAVSRRLGRAAILRYLERTRVRKERLERAESWFGRHGNHAVFFGRMVPVLRELVSIPAGILGMNVWIFVLYTFAGSVIWSTALIMLGYYVDAGVIANLT